MKLFSSSTGNDDQVAEIAGFLASHFLKPIFDFCQEKNYYVYVGSLSELIDWSEEFHIQYSTALVDWDNFKKTAANTFNAATPEEFLLAWGHKRINRFFYQHQEEIEYCSKVMSGASPMQSFSPGNEFR